MGPNTNKLGLLLSTALAAAGTWMDSAQPVLGLLALFLSLIVSILLIFNELCKARHNLRIERRDLEEEKKRVDEERRRLENLVCEERRKTGVCPLVNLLPKQP